MIRGRCGGDYVRSGGSIEPAPRETPAPASARQAAVRSSGDGSSRTSSYPSPDADRNVRRSAPAPDRPTMSMATSSTTRYQSGTSSRWPGTTCASSTAPSRTTSDRPRNPLLCSLPSIRARTTRTRSRRYRTGRRRISGRPGLRRRSARHAASSAPRKRPPQTAMRNQLQECTRSIVGPAAPPASALALSDPVEPCLR